MRLRTCERGAVSIDFPTKICALLALVLGGFFYWRMAKDVEKYGPGIRIEYLRPTPAPRYYSDEVVLDNRGDRIHNESGSAHNAYVGGY